ncbi:MAG: c-type cytochrome, partial [Planctomycetota bacterium]|nr:c-type cytochrome [Planctomycetota bacterium]
LSVFHDRDGDGVSEESQILVRNIGFGLDFRGADHTTNGIQLGIDGWIYVAVGDYGFIQATGSDGREVQMKGGGIARVRPDGSELELVSRGQRNIYDVAVSPLLDLFTRDNTNDGGGWNVRLSYVPHGAQMGYPSLFLNFADEIVQPLADYGGGSPCGSLYIDEPTLPGELGQSLYTCDWGRSVVYRHPLSPSGAGFVAEQEPFLEVPRPTDMEVDRSGNIYVSSWKDGGFNFGNPNVGYVIKVSPPRGAQENVPAAAANDPNSASTANLLARLASRSHTTRIQAQQEILRAKPSDAMVAGLEKLAGTESLLPVRVAALFTLKQWLGPKSHPFLLSQTSDATIREFALRALADRESELGDVSVDPFVAGLKDPNPRVRLQAVRGLGRFHLVSGDRARAVASRMLPLTVDRDPLVAHLAVRSLVALGAAETCLTGLTAESLEIRQGAGKVLMHLHDPVVVAKLVESLERPVAANTLDTTRPGSLDRATRQIVLLALCRLYHQEAPYTGDWWGTRPDTSGPYYKPANWSESEQIARALSRELTAGEPEEVKFLLPQLRRHKIELPGMQERLVKLATTDRDFFPTGASLLCDGSGPLTPEAVDLLEVAATAVKGDVPLRVAALRGFQRRIDQPGVFDAAIRSFAESVDGEGLAPVTQTWNEFIREPKLAAQVDALARHIDSADSRGAELVYAALTFISESPQAPQLSRNKALALVEAAWARPETAVRLLRGIGRGKLEAQVFQIQQQLKSESPAVQEAARFAVSRLELDQEPPIDPAKPLVGALKLEEVVAQVDSQKGDVKYGQRLFSRQGCVACHSVSASEPVKGPLLLDIAKRYKRHELVESIVKPSAKIAQGFESQYFLSNSGKIYDGFVVRESGEEVELRNVAGVSTILKKDEIEERGKRDVSIMPTGLVDKLTPQQLVSLLDYLESLKN